MSRAATRHARAAGTLLAAPAAALHAPAALRRAPGALRSRLRSASARTRRRLLAALLVLAGLAAGYHFWLRDSALVRVQHVKVTGLSGSDAPRQRAALIAAARDMTTLHVDEAALRTALAAGATVNAVHVSTDFPYGMRIEVVEKAAVAVLTVGSERVAVGSGGVLLPDVTPIPRDLPAIAVGAMPSGSRLGDGRAGKLVAAAAAAPSALRARVERLRLIPAKGLVAYLSDGPQVVLGSALDLRAKWLAAAAILADSTSRGASYIDVRLPARPVAGGLSLPPPAADEQPGAADTAAAATAASANAPSGAPGATTATPAGTPGTTTTAP